MTSLLAWIAYDSRRATALYLASDSRQTFDKGIFVDNCTKIYVAVADQNQSEIFGFCGDVAFSQQALELYVALLSGRVFRFLFEKKPKVALIGFTII